MAPLLWTGWGRSSLWVLSPPMAEDCWPGRGQPAMLLISWGGLFGSASLVSPGTDRRGEGRTLQPHVCLCVCACAIQLSGEGLRGAVSSQQGRRAEQTAQGSPCPRAPAGPGPQPVSVQGSRVQKGKGRTWCPGRESGQLVSVLTPAVCRGGRLGIGCPEKGCCLESSLLGLAAPQSRAQEASKAWLLEEMGRT